MATRSLAHLSIAVVIILGCLSCGSEVLQPTTTTPPPPPPASVGFMSARINGVEWAAGVYNNELNAFLNWVDAVPGMPRTAVLFGGGTYGTSGVTVGAIVQTPVLASGSFALGMEPNLGGLDTLLADEPVHAFRYHTDATHAGTLQITSVDTVRWMAGGTFSFAVINRDGMEATITDGRFEVPIMRNGEPPTGAARSQASRRP